MPTPASREDGYPIAAGQAEEAFREVGREFGRRINVLRELREFTLRMTRPWGGRPLDPERPADLLMAAIFARSVSTAWVALEASTMGFGEQAAMLNRSLFEDMVDAHWASINPEQAVGRYEQHLRHGKMLLADTLREYPTFYPVEKLPEFDPDDRAALDGIFGDFGHKPWSGINLHERVRLIEHLWTEEQGKEHLHFFRRVVHRENNQQLHLSASALNQLVRGHDEHGLTLRIGPAADMLDRALYCTFWVMGQTVSLILDHFEFAPPRRDELSETLALSYVFRDLSEEERRNAGRNDPCPCGSGKKFKHCHG